MDRRDFLKKSALAAAALPLSGALAAPESKAETKVLSTRLPADGYLSEPARKVPVAFSARVVVLGGGPAGFAAAVAAARQGSDVLLLERGYFLGGLFTGCDVTLLNNMYTPTREGRVQAVAGLCDELCKRLEQHGMLAWLDTPPNVDTEATKYLMEEMCAEAGVRILYGVDAAGVAMSGDRIEALFVETKAGRVAVRGDFFIDCSGDGDLLAWTGEDFTEFKYNIGAMYRAGGVKNPRKGWKTPNEGVYTMHLGSGIQDADGLDPRVLTQAQLNLRKQMWNKTQQLRTQPGNEGAFLLSTPSVVGVRVTRVLNSVFNVPAQGAVEGVSYDDAIGFTGADSNLHWKDGVIHRLDRRMWQVPYRSLVPKRVPNLLVAGRCFGYDQVLRYDAREVGTCLLTGEAAGVAAAQALVQGVSAREVDTLRLRKTLRAGGTKLDW